MKDFFQHADNLFVKTLKNISLIIFICSLFCFNLFALTEEEEYTVQNLIASIDKVQKPLVHDDFVVFTADKVHRFVGIAFDFENFSTVHSFYRNTFYDIEMAPRDSILFYVCKLPEKTKEFSYRMVIDGVWTTDPQNPTKYYNYEADTYFSKIEIETPIEEKTESLAALDKSKGNTRFFCEAKPNQKIRLGGSFTNWDSYIYELTEYEPGMYEIYLSLQPGTYYYNYYIGNASFIDKTNPLKAYTSDGKTASVIEVK